MSSSKKTNADDLARRLRTEATENSPEFSHSLHERIMWDVKLNRSKAAPSNVRLIWRPMWLATVAMVLLAILIGRLWMENREQKQITQIQSTPNELQTAWLTSWDKVAQPIQQQLIEVRFGYVDQDARRASRFLLSQLDVLPASTKDRRN